MNLDIETKIQGSRKGVTVSKGYEKGHERLKQHRFIIHIYKNLNYSTNSNVAIMGVSFVIFLYYQGFHKTIKNVRNQLRSCDY